MDYKPNTPFNVPFKVLIPTVTKVKGVTTKTFNESNDTFYCSFKTFGGTEKVVNDVLIVEDTAVIETWYDSTITSDCNIKIDDNVYEILGTPENINMQSQYLKFKVRLVRGGA